jgi:hypothetical protein
METVWHKAAEEGHVEILMYLWIWCKELQLKPEELINELLLSKDEYMQTAWHKAANVAMLRYYRKCGIGLKNCS